MKSYTLFEFDESEVRDVISMSIDEPSEGLMNFCLEEIDWVVSTLRTFKQDDEDVFNNLYRRSRLVSGLIQIHDNQQLHLLLEVLVFCTDFLRHKVQKKSAKRIPQDINYVINLVTNSANLIIKDHLALREPTVDFNDIMEECQNYLRDTFAILENETKRAGTAGYTQTQNQGKDPAPQTENLQIHDELDEEETLTIPHDKIGFISDYCEESREILGNVGLQLVELETNENPLPIISELFRGLHTLKGSARLLKIVKIEKLAHAIEDLLDRARKGEIKVTSELIDILLDSKKLLERMVSDVASRRPIQTPINAMIQRIKEFSGSGTLNEEDIVQEPALDQPLAKLEAIESDFAANRTPAVSPEKDDPVINESIRITTDKLDEVLNVASEVFITRIRLQNDVSTLNNSMKLLKSNLVDQDQDQLSVREFLENLELHKVETTINDGSQQRENLEHHDQHELQTEENIKQQGALHRFQVVDTDKKKLEKSIGDLAELSSRLQSSAMNIRMVPVRYAFDRFPTQVRETARALNKKIKLTVSGADTELDKVLINQLIEPMLHILRNAVDHGIELPEERSRLGKSETGIINISAYYQGSEAVIEISDDGKGIDTDVVLQKAIEQGLVGPENQEDLSQAEILNFIFEPGFSTSSELTTLSGRGVGMDAVRRAITHVRGTVSVETDPKRGSKFKIKLPLSLAVAGVLLIEEHNYKFAFPVLHVQDILTVERSKIEVFSQSEVFNYRGEVLPVTTISRILDFEGSKFNEEMVTIVVLWDDGKKKCVMVDSVLGRQDVIIKNLGDFVKHAPSVMGCTILSDNQLVLILNTWEIVNSKIDNSKKELELAS